MLVFGSNPFTLGARGLVIEPGPGLTRRELASRAAYLERAAIGEARRAARAFMLSLARRAAVELARLVHWRSADVEGEHSRRIDRVVPIAVKLVPANICWPTKPMPIYWVIWPSAILIRHLPSCVKTFSASTPIQMPQSPPRRMQKRGERRRRS